MQNQFSSVRAVLLLAIATVGVLLTAHLQRLAGSEDWSVPSWLLWAGETCVYLVALFAWAPRIGVAPLIGGIVGLFAIRWLISAGAGLLCAVAYPGREVAAEITACVQGVLPRSCSLIFAVLAVYPVRGVLSELRSGAPRRRQREVEVLESARADAVDAAVLSASRTAAMPAAKPASGVIDFTAAPAAQSASVVSLPDHLQAHQIAIPLASLSAQLPPGVLRADIGDRILSEGLTVEVPLSLIAPQLKEAQVQLSLLKLVELLPKQWVLSAEDVGEEKVTLPLDVIVPQVPDEVFALPAAEPLPWAALAQDEERIMFAQV